MKKEVPVLIPNLKQKDLDSLKSKGVSVAAFLDLTRPRQDGTSTVRIRIIFKRYPKYYTTRINMSSSDWLEMLRPRPRGELKNTKSLINTSLQKAVDIITEMDEFSFDLFDKKFHNKSNREDVFEFYTDYIKQLKEEKRIGNATIYEYSQKSLKNYCGKNVLSFKEITPSFLKRYESHITSQDKSLTTVGMYMRCLRFLYNQAISDGLVKRELYPFGKEKNGKYDIPRPQNIKKALKLTDIGKIFNYQPLEGSPEHFYRDLWLFSYLCNGINMKDICLLKYKDIQGEHIYFRRAKTVLTNRNSKPIDVILTEDVRKIIDRWGCTPPDSDSYIFPMLTDNLTPEKEQALIKQATKQTNKYIKRIAENVGITENVSTYTARHSFATVLKRSGVNVSFISDALGHSDLKTTENYLDSFEDEQKKEIAKKLTAWD